MLLAVREVARRLGISASKCYQLVARRSIPHYRVGGKILFREADLDAYLETCRVGPDVPTAPAPPGDTLPGGTFTQLNSQRLAKAWKEQGVL